MAELRADVLPRREAAGARLRPSPAAITLACVVLAIGGTGCSLWGELSPRFWLAAAFAPDPANPAELVVHFARLPRLLLGFLCGAGLALSGVLLQAALANPLAAPSTLGVSAGAQLALIVATLAAPDLLGGPGHDAVAIGGGGAVAGLVLLVASRRDLAPATIILAGLVAGLFAGALGAVLKLFDAENVGAVFLWGGGSLAQTDWSGVTALLPRLAALAGAAALLVRPLALLGLGESAARSLGVTPGATRAAAVAVAVLLAAVITGLVGVIGFVELAAPWLAAFAGARRLGPRLLHATLIGGCLLVAVDTAVQGIGRGTGLFLPTGGVAALLGAPLVLAFAGRLATVQFRAAAAVPDTSLVRRAPTVRGIVLGLVALATGTLAVLAIGRTGEGWSFAADGHALQAILAWRLPRTLAALSAGGLLGAAGALLQRLTGNPVASPETLGIGAGSAAGIVAATFVLPDPDAATLAAFGTGGALLAIAVPLAAAARSGFAPDRLLVTGVALAALLEAMLAVVLAVGDARSAHLLVVMSGLTYGIGTLTAVGAALATAILVSASLLFGRTLDILPLGSSVARGLGVPLGAVRGGMVLAAAVMTAVAVEVAGPLTFAGLVGPHLATRLGFRGGVAQVAGAACLSALLMVVADAIARTIVAPFEVPTGLVAALIGLPYLLVLLCRT